MGLHSFFKLFIYSGLWFFLVFFNAQAENTNLPPILGSDTPPPAIDSNPPIPPTAPTSTKEGWSFWPFGKKDAEKAVPPTPSPEDTMRNLLEEAIPELETPTLEKEMVPPITDTTIDDTVDTIQETIETEIQSTIDQEIENIIPESQEKNVPVIDTPEMKNPVKDKSTSPNLPELDLPTTDTIPTPNVEDIDSKPSMIKTAPTDPLPQDLNMPIPNTVPGDRDIEFIEAETPPAEVIENIAPPQTGIDTPMEIPADTSPETIELPKPPTLPQPTTIKPNVSKEAPLTIDTTIFDDTPTVADWDDEEDEDTTEAIVEEPFDTDPLPEAVLPDIDSMPQKDSKEETETTLTTEPSKAEEAALLPETLEAEDTYTELALDNLVGSCAPLPERLNKCQPYSCISSHPAYYAFGADIKIEHAIIGAAPEQGCYYTQNIPALGYTECILPEKQRLEAASLLTSLFHSGSSDPYSKLTQLEGCNPKTIAENPTSPIYVSNKKAYSALPTPTLRSAGSPKAKYTYVHPLFYRSTTTDGNEHLPALILEEDLKHLLFQASASGNVNAIRAITNRGTSIDSVQNDITPLIYATQRNNLTAVRTLAGQGADLNYRNRDGMTALHIATQNNRADIAEILLQMHASPNIRDNQGRTPYIIAADAGNAVLVQLLLQYGAKLYIDPTQATKLLHQSIASDNQPLTAALINTGANINQQDSYSYTPLHIAAYNGLINQVVQLVEMGADVRIGDQYGRTAYDLALLKNHHRIADYLAAYMHGKPSRIQHRILPTQPHGYNSIHETFADEPHYSPDGYAIDLK